MVVVGSDPVEPKKNQPLKTIPCWGESFKLSMDVKLKTYEYLNENSSGIFGEIVRFQAANAPRDIEKGSRIPMILVQKNPLSGNFENLLQVTSYIVNNADPEGPNPEGQAGEGSGPDNYQVNFDGDEAPKINEWFTITVSQLQKEVE